MNHTKDSKSHRAPKNPVPQPLERDRIGGENNDSDLPVMPDTEDRDDEDLRDEDGEDGLT